MYIYATVEYINLVKINMFFKCDNVKSYISGIQLLYMTETIPLIISAFGASRQSSFALEIVDR